MGGCNYGLALIQIKEIEDKQTRIYTKNYEKGYGCVGFDFRRIFVEESSDSELGWWIYGSSKVY